MTLASKIIQMAFREGNLIPIGSDPTAAEQSEALDRLNAFILGVYGSELGENLVDWVAPYPQRTAPVAANYPQAPYPMSMDASVTSLPLSPSASNIYPYPPKNSRIIFGGVSLTVFFPEQPEDGSRMSVVQGSGAGDGGTGGSTLTLDGNGRTIGGSATVALVDPLEPMQWLYRADLADWILVETLGAADQLPFPPEFDDLWVAMLAIRLAPRYGKTVSPDTKMTAGSMMVKLQNRYRQTQVTIYGSQDIPSSLQSYLTGDWFQ